MEKHTNNLKIIKYNEHLNDIWDDFIYSSYNGTIYHTRKFLNYHPENKFIDHSILIYNNNDLVSVVPAAKKGEKYFSHHGATYGGIVIKDKYWFSIKHLRKLVNLIIQHYDKKIEMRVANDIYFNHSQSTLIYLLSQHLNIKLELSWYITKYDINNIKNKDNIRNFKKIKKNDKFISYITDNTDDYINYYHILYNSLTTRHNSKPTHTLDDFLKVKTILKDKQKLCIVKHNDIIISGIFLIEVCPKKYYIFYISKNWEYKDINTNMISASLLMVVDYFDKHVEYDIIDLGITTENTGSTINEGLSIFKESSLCGISSYRYTFIL